MGSIWRNQRSKSKEINEERAEERTWKVARSSTNSMCNNPFGSPRFSSFIREFLKGYFWEPLYLAKVSCSRFEADGAAITDQESAAAPNAPSLWSGTPRAPSAAPACAVCSNPWRCVWTGRTPHCHGSTREPRERREGKRHGWTLVKESKCLSISFKREVNKPGLAHIKKCSLKGWQVSETSVIILRFFFF